MNIELKDNFLILDIGCGKGNLDQILSEKSKLICIDIKKFDDWNKIKNCNLDFLIADASNLPFRNNIYDVVIEKDALHHVLHYNDALKEMSRVTKKTGVIVLIEPNRYHVLNYIHLTLLRGHKHFSKDKFRNLVGGYFENYKIISFEAHVYPLRNIFLLNIIQKFENILEIIPVLKNYLSYNMIFIKNRFNSSANININNQYNFQKKYFDNEYKNYKKYHLENWRLSYLRRICAMLDMNGENSSYYLDIGIGGSGYTVIEAAQRGCVSVGIDISLQGVKKAKNFAEQILNNDEVCHFIVGSAEYLPFKKKVFSKISSIAVLEHLPNDCKAIEDMARVSKIQAKIVIIVPNAYKRILPIFWLPYYLHDKKIGHLRHYSEEQLGIKFKNHGFDIKNIFYSGHLVKIIQIVLSRFIPEINKPDSSLWWNLEKIDLKQKDAKNGLQLCMVFEKLRETTYSK
ncbi:MAG: class I SAM-dependent methyltransferase [Candidatus Methanoperedens sp.]|nr:class I SAM-dependent methyltransferase [Candidatus Methanoperedens sp.]MCZ7370644.1 class I SAM-dependent methyltransferase [Candidatus Methanoperedens sp.]